MEEHKGLDHENVLRLLYVDDTTNKDFTYLVLELCAGTLTDFCGGKYKGPMLPPDELVLYQIANGLNYIHSRDLVHRDVKPDNILISISTPITMKLSDFGFIKKVGSQETFSQSGLKGTLNWMAPEMLEILNSATDETEELPRGTIESDTFSAGCVFFYFVSRGLHPFGSLVLVPSNIVQNNPMQFNSYKQTNGSIPFSNWKQQQIKLQTQHDANIVELNFNGNGTQLAAGCISGDVYVWNYPGCELLFQTKQHLELIKDIEWNPIRHDWLATFTFLVSRVCLYSSSSKSVTKIYNTSIDYMRYINCVKWISENQIALAPAACGGIEIWDVHEMQSNMSAKIVRKYEVNDRISHLHWIENTKYLASCASSIKIWSTDCEEPIYSSNSWQRSGIYYFTWCPNLKPREDIEAERKSPNNFIFAWK
ncbi:hypothetical protein GHT06_004448 [Daphnia sinensis]|uniref:Protein kinase domain-containing protein n=1 Tax=Daphnia sinensis TaxID=1820382 RepID=A0AAD5PQ56_9CRUS|nr:hypothetical protein GHT06_004448 [Daphnia sinensis]